MRILTVGVLLSALFVAGPRAEDWPQWRGPDGTGITSERDLPEYWGVTDNVAWKAPIRGLGVSSPVVWGDLIFVTSQVGYAPPVEGVHPTLVRGGSQRNDLRTLGGGRGG